MLPIKRIREPASLLEHRFRECADYDNIQNETKREIRRRLIEQQGYVCAYCMSRIREDRMKVEHIKSQSEHPELQLDFSNLAACCTGGEGSPRSEQHCDTFKGERSLPFSIDAAVVSTISYSKDGAISSSREDVQRALNEILNLNLRLLCNNRKAVFNAVKKALANLPQYADKNRIKKLLACWEKRDKDGKFQEYAGVAIYFIQKRLRRCI